MLSKPCPWRVSNIKTLFPQGKAILPNPDPLPAFLTQKKKNNNWNVFFLQ